MCCFVTRSWRWRTLASALWSKPWWKRRLGLTFVHRMLLEADDFDLHVVPLEGDEAA